MRSFGRWLGLAGFLGACQFERPPNVGEEDARAVDAAPTCTADTITCAAGVYIECGPDGFPTRQLTCPIACAPDEARCLDLDPHNGLATYLDMVSDPPDVTLAGTAVIDTVAGTIFDDGVGIDVPTFLLRDSAIRVFVVRSLTVDGHVAVPKRNHFTPSLAFLATADITINGVFDISADGPLAAPGGRVSDIQDDPAPCVPALSYANPPTPSVGGGGAGGDTAGGKGGDTTSTMGAAAGSIDASIEPLVGGCAGGVVYNTADGSYPAVGGAGGGGLQLSSRTLIGLYGAAILDASGGGATAGQRNVAGAGGGAGGRLVIEAPQVILDGPAVVLSTKGGGGSGAASLTAYGGSGQDGDIGPDRALGGISPVQSLGGRGGNEQFIPGGGGYAGSASVSGGGGGGACGTTAFFTSNGAVSPANGAALRSRYTVAPLRTRRVP